MANHRMLESNLRPGQFSTCTRRGSNKLLPGVPHHRTFVAAFLQKQAQMLAKEPVRQQPTRKRRWAIHTTRRNHTQGGPTEGSFERMLTVEKPR